MTTTKNIVIAVAALIVLALLGYFTWQEKQGSESSTVGAAATSTTVATSTGISIDLSSAAGSNTNPAYTIKTVPITSNGPTPPNYKTPLSYPASMSADQQAQDQSQFTAVQAALAANSTDYNGWLSLGSLRRDAGDYQGAAADWKYVTEIYPKDPTAFANLGDLYANYLHQSAQGISYYKQAIKLDPTKELNFYQNLAQIYIDEGDTADAKATLQQGITAQVVGYQNLQAQLSSM